MKIKIHGQNITIIENNPGGWSENGMGRWLGKNGEILINSGMPDDIKDSVLLHEIIHALADMNALNLSETQVSVLANGLFETLRANPDLSLRLIGA